MLYALLRTWVQGALMGVAGWLTAQGVDVPAGWPEATSVVLVAAVAAGVVAGVGWLERRQGDGWLAYLARVLAKVLMAGLSKQPVYPEQPKL